MRILKIALVTSLLALASLVSGEPTANRKNSLGVTEVYHNPYTYLVAIPIDGHEIDGGYNIRFWPFSTPLLYDETVFFCSIGSKFDDKTGPLVIVYETRAHHMHDGIGCHELKAVLELKTVESF